MTQYKCGDILLATYPHTDQIGSKVRPVLVVSSNAFNQGEDVVLVPISSVPDPSHPHALFLDQNDPEFSLTGLRCSSSVKWTKPYTASARIIMRRLGRLAPGSLSSVRASIVTMFE